MKKKWLALLLSLVMVFSCVTPTAIFAEGEEVTPDVTIATAQEFVQFAQDSKTDKFAGKLIVLTADIDFTGIDNFPGVGENTTGHAFAGTFDGQGHTISNLHISNGEFSPTLFRHVAGGTIKNFTVTDSSFTAGSVQYYGRAGAVAGCFYGNGTVSNICVTSTVTVEGWQQNGGVVGFMNAKNATLVIEDCFCAATVLCGSGGRAGGICGGAENGTIVMRRCVATGAVGKAGGACSGGLIGQVYVGTNNSTSALVEDCVSEATIYGNNVGTIVGNTGANNVTFNRVFGRTNNSANTPIQGNIAYLGTGIVSDASYSGLTLSAGNANALLAAAYLSHHSTFAGGTIQLTADIDLNPGWIASDTAPSSVWPIIGNDSKHFAGTFDGQGHSISGMYVNGGSTEFTGMFRYLKNGTARNFRLLNSYFAATQRTASIVGKMEDNSLLDTVYSNAIVSTTQSEAGGLVSRAQTTESSKPAATIRNCWFDGSATVGDTYAGGLVANACNLVTLTIQGCLNSGTISAPGTTKTAGGLVAMCMNGGNTVVNISDSLNVGTVTATGAWGSIAGQFGSSPTTLTNVFATTESCVRAYSNGSAVTGTAVRLPEAAMSGVKAYQYTTLSFADNWAAQEGSTPVLKSFADAQLDLTGLTACDMSWYSAGASEYTISTAGGLQGLAALSQTNNFSGKTVKLGADIDLNPGWTASAAAPGLEWLMIGAPSLTFAGVFNGQNHTVSGVYVNGGDFRGFFSKINTSGTSGFFTLTNSYISGSGVDSHCGGIVGRMEGGTISSVHVTDTVRIAGAMANGSRVGGIAGVSNGTAAVITNCMVEANITAQTGSGGIVGMIGVGNTTISHCLFTGSVVTTGYSGGIVGNVEKWATPAVTISDCLSTGTVQAYKGGFLAGNATAGVSLTLSGSYGIGTLAVGNGSAASSTDVAAVTAAQLTGSYAALNAPALDYDNYWAAIEDGAPQLKSFRTGAEADVSNVLERTGASAPAAIPAGKVFGGWYADAELTVPVAEDYTGLAFAKFVDSDVMGVKSQKGLTQTAQGKTRLRVVTSVDSMNYREVGFRITYRNASGVERTVTASATTVYASLIGYTDPATSVNYEPTVFSDESIRFVAFRLTASDAVIAQNGDGISVQPYWITADGVTVEGETFSGIRFN